MRRILVVLALLASAAGCATGQGRDGPARSASVERGRFLVLRACAGCHAVSPLGMSPNLAAPPFSIIRLRHDGPSLQRLLADISSKGHHEMPPIYMSDEEIGDIAAYIQTVDPVAPTGGVKLPKVRQAQAARSAEQVRPG